MQTKPSDAAFSAVFRTSMNADRKQLYDTISGAFMAPIVIDKCVIFRGPSLNRSRKIPPEAVLSTVFS